MWRTTALALLVLVGTTSPMDARRRPRKSAAIATFTPNGNPNLQAHAAVIVDLENGTEYFARNPDAVRPIASISKLMAALVVLERGLVLDQVQLITAADRKAASRGSRSRLVEGMKITNRDLLHAALMASDNRAIPALGRAVGLDPHDLSKVMTARAHALGLSHTEFQDPIGLHDGNVSTPREVVRLLKFALANSTIAEILRTSHYWVRPIGHGSGIPYNNTDRLVQNRKWSILGGKTGYTDIARYCLVIATKVEGREVGMAFLGAEGKLTRFGDFTRSMEWLTRKRLAAKQSTAAAQ